MGGLARIAKEAGYQVSGSDKVLYPPMSDQLAQADITLYEGFDPAQLDPPPDLAIIGNAQLGRGHPGIEHILNRNLSYMSGRAVAGGCRASRSLGDRRGGHARAKRPRPAWLPGYWTTPDLRRAT